MDNITTFYFDLLEVQKEIKDVSKDASNPFFKSKYATLGATIEACKEILNKHNILCLQPIESDLDGVYVCTTLYHVPSDKSLTTKMRIMSKSDNDPQAQGSAITYARRYSLQSLLFMNAEDDDGNSASKPTMSVPKPSTAPQITNNVCPTHGDPVNTYGGHKMPNGEWCNDYKYPRANVVGTTSHYENKY